ncbi:MAG: DNA gyrase subunit A [Mycoplasma sp.]|nr:DNA gyrase subunit A [Candidatus Hennigella equi]
MAKENEIREQLEKSKVEEKEIAKELQNSFLEYAMSVIVARALPDARDGFKPVHRRVLYAAWNLGMTSGAQYKKSARLVGEVIGKYHPHGDTAVYETMVRMAQDFSMRYPLIDGHGNFGSIDGDGAAAMRYTEAKMSKLADTMLNDIEKNTVELIDNYDGTEKEPVVLPSLFPNMLANGSSGIAVGMATNMPPHNLGEIAAGVEMVAKNPNCSIDEIMTVLKGPDFPTGASIIGGAGIKEYFETGHGSVTVRSKTDIEYMDNGKPRIIVHEIPYVVNKSQLIEKITQLVKDDKIQGITDLRDESNRLGIRIVIELRRDVVPEVILNQLFKMTQLQTSFSVNMLALVNNEPRVLNMKEALQIYIDHQLDVLTKRTKFDLDKAKARLHILEGLHIASQHIDEIIKMIKNAKDDKKLLEDLMHKFKLSEIQAKAILEMKLRSLSGMEQAKITNEIKELEIACKEYESILANRDKQIDLMLDALKKLVDRFGDERRTEISYNQSSSIDDEDLIPIEDIVITMSTRGYLKRLPIDEYRSQHRGGVGVTGTATHNDDNVAKIVVANTHTDILIFTDYGKVYRLRGHEIPVGSKQSKGIPAINFIQIEKDEKIITMLPIDDYEEQKSLIFCSANGIVKRTSLIEYEHINRNGKIALGLKEGDKLFDVKIVAEENNVFIGNSTGKLVRFKVSDVRNMGRTAAGVKGINIDGGTVVGFSTSLAGNKILSIGTRGVGKITDVEEYRETKRGAKGVTTLKVTPKTGKLVFAAAVEGNEDALIMTKKNMIIRMSLSEVRDIGRATQGVKLIRLDDDDRIASIAIFKNDEAEGGEPTPSTPEGQETVEVSPENR